MKRSTLAVAAVAFALGAMTVLVAKPKTPFDPNAYYAGKDPKAAAQAMVARAETLAGNGSWERIGVGRVYYASGQKDKGKAIFDAVLASPKLAKSDVYRIADAYAFAHDWASAKPLYEKAIAMDPEDDKGLIKAGCWANLNGDRKDAEEKFGRAFAIDQDNVWSMMDAAGSYVGVEPF